MKYAMIYADPPWSYKFESPTAAPRPPTSQKAAGVAYYYPTMTVEQIKALPVQNICAKDAVLYLWATTPLLPEALEVMKAWGFTYKTKITWHKLNCKGMGYWFRGHTEDLLFGVRGNVRAFRSMQKNIVEYPVCEHSRKPEIFREIIEKASPALSPRIELFARDHSPMFPKVDRWDRWGNEVSNPVALEVT